MKNEWMLLMTICGDTPVFMKKKKGSRGKIVSVRISDGQEWDIERRILRGFIKCMTKGRCRICGSVLDHVWRFTKHELILVCGECFQYHRAIDGKPYPCDHPDARLASLFGGTIGHYV